jgi:hypothetical protein
MVGERGTLEHMTSLSRMEIYTYRVVASAQDWDIIFSLLLTSTSLQEINLFSLVTVTMLVYMTARYVELPFEGHFSRFS